MPELIKSKSRVRDHGEVYTPDFIVEAMLALIPEQTIRMDARFLEPACGNGNFLIAILTKKIQHLLLDKYAKLHQEYFEQNLLVAVGSIYGVDLLADNIYQAQERLFTLVEKTYHKLFKKKIKADFLQTIHFILSKNIIQGDALSLRNSENQPLCFSQRTQVGNGKIKRHDYIFEELLELSTHGQKLTSDSGETHFIPQSIQEYPPQYFLSLYQQENEPRLQSRCTRCTNKPEQ